MDAALEATLHDFFVADSHGAVAVYVFGSVSRGTSRASSDVDIAVLFEQAPPSTLDGLPVDLQHELERVADRTVDLVVLNRASPDLVHRVLRDGTLVFEGDRSKRVRFEVKLRAEYFDLLPVLQEYRRPRHTAQVMS